jgi:glyoxylase-like metal-dependent hydrolase (beta-lactamase superfamily II)
MLRGETSAEHFRAMVAMADNMAFPEIDPSLEGVYQVYAMCYARAPGRRVHENFMVRDMHDGPMPLDFNVWILRNDHRAVLVDTGFGHRAAGERKWPLDIDPIEALAQLGIDPNSIDDVVITHLHFDHAGNLDRFAKARFHVQDAEVAFATGRCMCEAHLRRPFDIEDVVTLVRHTYAERVHFHDGDANILPGISVHALHGHSQGLQGVRVMTARGPILLASDASHFYANFLQRAPFALTVDAAATLRSYARMMELGGSVERIIPGHDPKVRDLYPVHTIRGIKLTALHEAPKPHDIAALCRTDDV